MLTENTIIKQVAILPNQSAINVQWANQILKDGEVISEQYHRKAYGPGQQAEFLAEVEGAADYVNLIDWTVVDDQPA